MSEGTGTATGVWAEAREIPGLMQRDYGWYVYWSTPTAHGSMGSGLTQKEAERLAADMRSGKVRP